MAVFKYLNANDQWEIIDSIGTVKYIEQNLSDEQKAQARANIGLDGDFLTQENLQEATDAALTQAKESGEFDGQSGEDGKTPYIQDGNWWIDNTDTGVKAEGADGYSPVKGTDYYTPDEVDATVAEIIEQTKSSGDYVSLMGADPIASLSEDTPINWAKNLSAGYYFITQDGIVTDKPSSYGYIVNYRYGNTEVFQFWLSMMYGDVYTRSGNSTGWGTTWQKINGGSSNGIEYKGKDPITSLENDTPATWNGLGYGMWEITPTGSANIVGGIASAYMGTIINIPMSGTIYQLWLATINQGIYTRSAASITGNTWTNTWKSIKVDKNEIVQEVLNALPTWTGGSY